MADDDRGTQHRDGYAVLAEQVLHLAPRPQVGRQGAVIGAQAAHVDDLAQAGLRRGRAEVARRLGILALEVGVVEGVHQVDRDVHAVEGRLEQGRLHHVGADRLAGTVVRLGVARHRADLVSGLDQGGDEPAADEAGGAGDENGGHG